MDKKFTWCFTYYTLSEVYYQTFLDKRRRFFMNHNKDKIIMIKYLKKEDKRNETF